ncbi:MAG: histidinol-phosphate transaminase [Candidatus Limnocylindrales bacterium]
MTDAARRTGTSQVYTWEPSNQAIAARYGVRPDMVVRFDTNTSPTPPGWLPAALGGPYDPTLNEYPDSEYAELTAAAAAYTGVDPSEILVGAGADEVLDVIAKTFLPPDGAAIVPVPTYGMYGVLTSQRPARVLPVPRLGAETGFALDLPAVVARLPEAQLVWLTVPNNPTGRDEPEANVMAILDAAAALAPSPSTVVVDEAYHEFIGRTVLSLRERYPHLIVVRTLSKAFALPGIRIGYAVAVHETIARLERLRPPGSVSTISATIGATALRAPAVAAENVRRLVAERERFAASLAEAGWEPLPSVTNFLLVRIGDHDAAEAAAERLLHRGLVPRTFGPANPLRGHLRLTVRSAEENARLIEAIHS